MLNRILSGVCTKLSETFEGSEIFTEAVENGFGKNCFYVVCKTSKETQLIGKRFKLENSFKIMYFPNSRDKNEECTMVSNMLGNCLMFIDVDGDLVRGTGLSGVIEEGVLNYTVSYNMIVYKEDETDVVEMGEYKLNIK